jgi:hypothetical protein
VNDIAERTRLDDENGFQKLEREEEEEEEGRSTTKA